MKTFTLLLPLLLIFLTACLPLKQGAATPKQKKKIHINKLNKEVKELDSHDKRLIYKSIKNEIRLYHQKGDEDYKNGYYHDAAEAYELVNFYEGYPAISRQKIANIKAIAKQRAYLHYKKAQKYLRRDKKRATIELNSVIMNDPNYKDAQELYDELINDRAMHIHINALENSLETKLINNQGSYQELKAIQKSLNNLAKYDYKNTSLQKARDLLRSQKNILLKDAISIYKKGNLKKAKQLFVRILSLYPDDTTATNYMERIAFKQSKKHNLAMAKKALKENNYLESISHAKKVLRLEAQNKEAREIIATANRRAKTAVKKFVNDGKRYYNNKNLDQAKQCFEEALKIDKTNNTSLIYHKKIQRQLQTIKSLQ
jgi:hypothetical protein